MSAAETTRISVDAPGDGAAIDPTRTLTITGWAVDPTAVGSAAPAGVDAVHVYLNGEAGRGGQLLGAAEIGLARPDVAAALGDARLNRAGFQFRWRPSVLLDAGPQQLYVYARNLAGDWTFLVREIALPAAPAAAVGVATAAFTERNLGVPVGGPDCPRAEALGFRRSDDEPQYSDNWYDTSQLLADAALLASGRDDALCRLRKGWRYIQRQWDARNPIGGFHPRTNPEGTQLLSNDKYVDDNALAGLAVLGAAAATPDPEERAAFLRSAEGIATWLIRAGVWDDVFEGGFWWNDHKGDTEEGKPAQTNAVTAFFFLRLYRDVPNPTYLEWGLRTLDWMDRILWVNERGVYRWSIRYQDLQRRVGVVRSERYFSYDQSIAAEAWLEVDRHRPERGGLARARALAERLRAGFWSAQLGGGYDLEQGVSQVFTAYSAWVTPAFLRLYRADGDSRWLDLARENVEALDRTLRDETGGGYFYVMFLENGARIIGREKHTVAQAWMQYSLAALASPQALLP